MLIKHESTDKSKQSKLPHNLEKKSFTYISCPLTTFQKFICFQFVISLTHNINFLHIPTYNMTVRSISKPLWEEKNLLTKPLPYIYCGNLSSGKEILIYAHIFSSKQLRP